MAALRLMAAIDFYLVVSRKQTFGSGGMMSGLGPATAFAWFPEGITTPQLGTGKGIPSCFAFASIFRSELCVS
ncbi:hypothetical protein CK218_00025 [Mesorhizobium sp. WSM3879]|nr:hypothetical protein CK218_00025 [Mesorhizobium sp. WSM3879]